MNYFTDSLDKQPWRSSFKQEQLVDTLQSDALQRAVLRNLRESAVKGAELPTVDWRAVQLEVLNSSWIHRIQKLKVPEMQAGFSKPDFPLK